MANVNLGKVALTPAGNYSSTSTYDKLDIVNYQGSSFVAKKAVPVGTTTSNNEYWQEIAGVGPTGPTGPQGPIGHTIEWGEIVGNIENQQDLNTSLSTLVREQQQLITNIEPDMKASTNYTAGELVIVDNKLLRVTSTITTGSSFTIGTNVEQVNLETVINEKANQTSVSTALATKAPLASPALTGTPTAPTPTSGDNSTKIATTAFVQDVAEKKQNLSINSASGSIVSFTDGADDLPVTGLTVGIEPVQDLHGQDAPWPAGGGSNIWDEVWENGTYDTSTGQPGASDNYIRSKNAIPCSPETNYYVVIPSSTLIWILFWDSSDTYLGLETRKQYSSSTSFTTPANATKMKFYVNVSTYGNNIAINYPSTVTTYSPYENICPISGFSEANVTRTGINIWDEEWELGTLSTATGLPLDSNSQIRTKNYISVKPNTTYRNIGYTLTIYQYDINHNMISYLAQPTGTFTISENTYYLKFWRTATTYNHDISINYPATDTQYHAYQGTSVTIDLTISEIAPDGIYYGGTVDVLAGTMTVDRASISLVGGDEATYIGNGTGGGTTRTLVTISDKANGVSNIISDIFRLSIDDSYTVYTMSGRTQSNKIEFRLPDTVANNGTAIKAWFAENHVQLVYELVQPVTVQLSPQQMSTLLGQNNIWADTGNILNLEYWNRDAQDLGNAIERRIQASQRATRSIIAGIETGMIASKNYNSGDLLIVGNDLLKATSNITSTSTLVIGTNVAKTTVAEQLIALAS